MYFPLVYFCNVLLKMLKADIQRVGLCLFLVFSQLRPVSHIQYTNACQAFFSNTHGLYKACPYTIHYLSADHISKTSSLLLTYSFSSSGFIVMYFILSEVISSAFRINFPKYS